ncbi:MAG: ACP S-malonyltransferase [Elainellaceae cyanobacterium]
MTKTAWVFPGQGSQTIGMGSDLVEQSVTQDKFEKAELILGWSVPDVCQNEDDKVSRTLYTQPCLYVIESILADALAANGHAPALVAGHSLGEYVALYAAGVFDFETGLRLVQRRAELMDQASGGLMAALIGFDAQQLQELLQNTSQVVLANDNSAGQIVISGEPNAVEAVMAEVKAKRKVKLNVSGAFHSPFMAEAAAEFEAVLESVAFQDAHVPVLSNVDPSPMTDAQILKERLVKQMTGSVRWREISLRLPQEGIDCVIEVGPGKVLTGLMKRTCSEVGLKNVSSLADLADF